METWRWICHMDSMDMDIKLYGHGPNMDMDTWTTQAHILTTRLRCGSLSIPYRVRFKPCSERKHTHVRDVGCGRVGAQMLAIARAS